MNHAQWLLDRLNDPTTPRAQYMAYWQEWQDLQQRQAHLNWVAANRTPAATSLRTALHTDARTHIGRLAARS